MSDTVAEQLALKQKAISIAEFFEKNKQVLGFDNPAKSLLTAVKEAVDNALDACEEAEILPDVFVKITRLRKDIYKIAIEDNGPGIVKEQIPRVFAKLLYGSRFHSLRQSRGQQGIGISAAVLYSQLTTGKPTTIISRTSPLRKASFFKVQINIKSNEPEIIEEKETDWDRPRGTRIEMELVGSYWKNRRQSVYEYLKATSVVNPHARITFVDPDGEVHVFERVTEQLPPKAIEIKPHPHGIGVGQLIRMAMNSEEKTLVSFLVENFVRVGKKTAEEICIRAGVDPGNIPNDITRFQAENLIEAFKGVSLLPPPTDCLSPIGEELIKKGILKEYNVEFITTVSRKPKVYGGNPFLVEVGLGYGGSLSRDGKAILLRYANRVPLLYQQSGCVLTRAVESINWKSYDLQQSQGELPMGPVVVLVHVASTNIPFTSESKEAVASVEEILSEVRLALQDAGRKLREYLSKKRKFEKRKEKEEIIAKILPLIVKKVSEILEKEEPDLNRVVARIMGKLYVHKYVVEKNGIYAVKILVENFGTSIQQITLYDTCEGAVEETENGKVVEVDGVRSISWNVKIRPGEKIVLSYVTESPKKEKPLIEGIDEDLVEGARVLTLGGDFNGG
jgi:DNA topoisomerase-6 subunit B